MRKLHRTVTVGAIVVPLAFGAAGVAFAAPGGFDLQDQGIDQAAAQQQGNVVKQGNTNVAPVTQLNPAVNANDITGAAGFFAESGTDQSITQDNSVESTNRQGNDAAVEQDQSVDQDAAGGDQQSEGRHQAAPIQGEAVDQAAAQGQHSAVGQGNDNLAPVRQANPAVNTSDVTALGGGAFDESATSQDITQDNSVDSRNLQGNAAGTDQGQSADQDAQGGDQLIG